MMRAGPTEKTMTQDAPPAGAVQLIDLPLVVGVLTRAQDSPRLRMNYNFHARPEENPNRLLNVLVRGTYITPHRHLDPPKAETFLVLQGRIAFFIFDEEGGITARHDLGPGGDAPPCWGIDIGPGVWHTLVTLTDHAVCFEAKPGPYLPATDKAFAPWAPRESDPGCAAYLEGLLRHPG